MGKGYLWFFLLAIFSLLIFHLRVYFRLRYRRDGADDDLVVEISVWPGFIKYRLMFPLMRLNGSRLELSVKASGARSARSRLWRIRRWYRLARDYAERYVSFTQALKGHVYCDKLVWTTCLGTDDAADTGVLVGFIWLIKILLLTGMSRRVKLRTRVRCQVRPDYVHSGFRTELTCIFSISLGNIIGAGIRFLKEGILRRS